MRFTRNDATPNKTPSDMSEGVKKFMEFHQLEPKRIATFAPGFKIPKKISRIGAAEWVAYCSSKWTGKKENYIHDHQYGVNVYEPNKNSLDYPVYAVPNYISNAKTLIRLGDCIGYDTKKFNDKSVVEKSRYPSLYCTPNGRALLVIEGRSRLIAMIWGGGLDVTARGIVG